MTRKEAIEKAQQLAEAADKCVAEGYYSEAKSRAAVSAAYSNLAAVLPLASTEFDVTHMHYR